MPHRRIVTGLDAAGRSAIILDGAAEMVAWATAETPVDNSGVEDQGGEFYVAMPRGGSKFLMVEIPPAPGELFGPGMHATDTIDYLVVIKGEAVLVTENGETTCHVGDMIVDRGVMHGWRNDGTEPAFLACVMIDAAPVGNGATLK
ncbi:cupin domain-containing protein [Sphingobium sp. DEHP117]|uniref:cupin domain-containing protein n=1 Tax=Sphingobium sp. DEHP117 TaxID=2993436 RepID=UPI0027D71446|nr:cupin domain-containing protein [Sphingobium sp. DEHP117]MDQ4421381.1 cupin domain-containing protein [Sphingobium sp. DEHP117]